MRLKSERWNNLVKKKTPFSRDGFRNDFLVSQI